MFVSFFPSPRAFFWSAAIWSLICVLAWFFFFKDFGAHLGLPNPPEGAEPIIGASRFWSAPFLWFYLYFGVAVAVFALFWRVYAPHPWAAWSVVGTAIIVFLTYFQVELQVGINAWYGPFYDLLNAAMNAKQNNKPPVTASELYWGALPFGTLSAVSVTVLAFQRFFVRHYIFRWRHAMNDYYVSHWPKLRGVEGASQRVQEDTMRFARSVEQRGTTVLDAITTLVAFLPVLWGYSTHITELPLIGAVPQGLVFASIIWSVFGTIFIAGVGFKLPGLEFRNQRVEASYRKELVYGEDDSAKADMLTLRSLFTDVRKNYFRMYFHYLYFDVLRRTYLNVDNVFSLMILIPSLALGKISLGLFNQISQAFDQVRESIQVLVRDWESIIDLISVYKRLRTFESAIHGEAIDPKSEYQTEGAKA